MILSRTLFIIGAGASKEVGLPTGDELKDQIAERLNIDPDAPAGGDSEIRRALEAYVAEAGQRGTTYALGECMEAARTLGAAMPLAPSIDRYMEIHQVDPKVQICGKLAIVKSILEAEHRSKLFKDPGRPPDRDYFKNIDGTWFVRFFKMLSEDCKRDKVEELFKNTAIINFNYDRCIEHFLELAVGTVYGLRVEEASAAVQGIQHFHPFGTVGQWREGRHHPFGKLTDNPDELLRRAGRIRTFTERTADNVHLAAMRGAVSEAQNIVFLGFAFHPLNLDLIQPNGIECNTRRVFATTLGMSAADADMTISRIKDFVARSDTGHSGRGIRLFPGTCSELFGEYSNILSRH